ncbi:MAG TPA: hypothetical protein VGL91_26085 [Acidobacteriota bacterium]|jgi:hypothetical protein
MRITRALLVVAVLLHLLLVALFIWTGFAEDWPGKLPGALRVYKNLSGTFRDYAFFAPAVASDLKAGFLVTDTAGEETFVNFVAKNREVGFRYNCIIAACMRDVRGRDLFAQSWAALPLGSNPDANRVTVMVKTLDLPSMRDYRAGKRPEWKTVYVGEFGRL